MKFAKLFVFVQFVVFATDAHDANIASINIEKNTWNIGFEDSF